MSVMNIVFGRFMRLLITGFDFHGIEAIFFVVRIEVVLY